MKTRHEAKALKLDRRASRRLKERNRTEHLRAEPREARAVASDKRNAVGAR